MDLKLLLQTLAQIDKQTPGDKKYRTDRNKKSSIEYKLLKTMLSIGVLIVFVVSVYCQTKGDTK